MTDTEQPISPEDVQRFTEAATAAAEALARCAASVERVSAAYATLRTTRRPVFPGDNVPVWRRKMAADRIGNGGVAHHTKGV